MILICDDDQAIRSTLTLVLRRSGYDTHAVASPSEAIEFLRRDKPRVIIMDMNYSKSTSGEEGLTLLRQAKIFSPQTPVILITAWGTINLAVRGIQAGAFDFITKPWNNAALLNVVETAIELNRQFDSTDGELTTKTHKGQYDNIIGKSPLLHNIFTTIDHIAKTNASVLITGESGTGKELIAQAIHSNSKRRGEPFVKVNLGGISQTLFESEMFGHKQGAFTDARYDRVGRFEMANHGSIFLDEIGELDPSCQVKLLRVLQDQTFEVLGDSRQRQVDVRIISATNRNLSSMVADGLFREDLFYRINLITIRIPSLRERIDDIPLLVNHFAKLQAKGNSAPPATIEPSAMEFLKTLPYPGNIRELKNLVERTILVSSKETITQEDFKAQTQYSVTKRSDMPESVLPLDDLERGMIEKALELYGQNLSKVATALGLSRQALYRRMEKYGLND